MLSNKSDNNNADQKHKSGMKQYTESNTFSLKGEYNIFMFLNERGRGGCGANQ